MYDFETQVVYSPTHNVQQSQYFPYSMFSFLKTLQFKYVQTNDISQIRNNKCVAQMCIQKAREICDRWKITNLTLKNSSVKTIHIHVMYKMYIYSVCITISNKMHSLNVVFICVTVVRLMYMPCWNSKTTFVGVICKKKGISLLIIWLHCIPSWIIPKTGSHVGGPFMARLLQCT